MIFVTVGSQLPFDRLIQAMDEWAGRHPDIPVFAQVGESTLTPAHMEFAHRLGPDEYNRHFMNAKIIVSHCGMGTIITGLENGKPLILMPRRHKLKEHRNDHQLRTAERFAHFDLIDVVHSADAMEAIIQRRLLLECSGTTANQDLQPSPQLIARLRSFVGVDSADE